MKEKKHLNIKLKRSSLDHTYSNGTLYIRENVILDSVKNYTIKNGRERGKDVRK